MARNSYHYAVRRIKKQADLIRAQKLLEAAETGTTDLLREMKKVRGAKNLNNDLPEEVAGASGDGNIADNFL